LRGRSVIQFTFARRGWRYHRLCHFRSRPGTSPWLGPPASKAGRTYPARDLRAGFFARKGLGAIPHLADKGAIAD